MGLTLYVTEGVFRNEIFLLKDWQLLVCSKSDSFRSESWRKGTSWYTISYPSLPQSSFGYGLASQSTLNSPQSGREDWVKGNRVVLRPPQGNSSGQSLWVLFEAWDE
nr:hypothetical protein Iba_chr07eCG12730 [Ipomoea batatas]